VCALGRCWARCSRPSAKSLRMKLPQAESVAPCGMAKGQHQGIKINHWLSEGRFMGPVLEPVLEEGMVNDPEKG